MDCLAAAVRALLVCVSVKGGLGKWIKDKSSGAHLSFDVHKSKVLVAEKERRI